MTPGLEEALLDNAAGKAALDLADSFLGESADRLENDIVKTIYDQLVSAPDALFQYTTSSGGIGSGHLVGGKFGLSRFKALQEAFESPRYSTLGTEAFEKAVVKPSQVAYFRKATDPLGRIQGKKLESLFRVNSEYTETLYGKESAKAIQELGVALNLSQNVPQSNSVVMQLVQGGMMVKGLQAAASVGAIGGGAKYGGREGALGGAAVSGAVLFISPVVLTKLLTKPATIRAITKGIQAGPKTAAFQRAVATIAAINAAERTELADIQKLGSRAVDFYSQITQEAPQAGPGANFGGAL